MGLDIYCSNIIKRVGSYSYVHYNRQILLKCGLYYITDLLKKATNNGTNLSETENIAKLITLRYDLEKLTTVQKDYIPGFTKDMIEIENPVDYKYLRKYQDRIYEIME